jgi:hypothetical protein
VAPQIQRQQEGQDFLIAPGRPAIRMWQSWPDPDCGAPFAIRLGAGCRAAPLLK